MSNLLTQPIVNAGTGSPHVIEELIGRREPADRLPVVRRFHSEQDAELSFPEAPAALDSSWGGPLAAIRLPRSPRVSPRTRKVPTIEPIGAGCRLASAV
jgi:hypothetical protein